jgi:hypothetical protein
VAKFGFWQRVWDRFAPVPSLQPVCVAEVASRIEAELMTGFLRNNGINAHMAADDAGGTDPVFQLAFGVRVLVPPGQADEARRLLAEAENG